MKRLLAVVRERAKAKQALEIRLYVHQNNVRAIKAYRRAGFADSPYQIMPMKP